MKTILLTGGAGFIGSHIAETYLHAGYRVVVVDNLASGKRENIPPEAAFYEADITDKQAMEEIFGKERPRIVNHQAAHINLRRSVEDPLFDARCNIMGSIVLIDLSIRANVERFIFASTGGAMYGEPARLPVSEDTSPNPLSPYGVAKRSVELYLECYRQTHGLSSVILRYGNVYGPRQDTEGEAGVVAIFSKKILIGETCTIYGDGTQTRDYVYVEDVSQANLLALEGPPGIYNIGTGIETSVLELVHLLRETSSHKVKANHSPPRAGEVARITLSCKHAEKHLHWKAQVGLQEGITRTFRWFAERR